MHFSKGTSYINNLVLLVLFMGTDSIHVADSCWPLRQSSGFFRMIITKVTTAVCGDSAGEEGQK